MFAGNTFGVTSDVCPPLDLGAAPNLASELLAGGHTFGGFSEDLPTVARRSAPLGSTRGSTCLGRLQQCASRRVHAVVGVRRPLRLRQLADRILRDPKPGQRHARCSITQADGWLQENLATYATWAKSNNSLLIVTWDEDDDSAGNRIPTIFYGAHVPVATDAAPLNHYNLLSTIEDLYGLPKTGLAANAPAIMNVWA